MDAFIIGQIVELGQYDVVFFFIKTHSSKNLNAITNVYVRARLCNSSGPREWSFV